MTELQYDPDTTDHLLGVVADVLQAVGDPGIFEHVAIVGGLVPTLMADQGVTPETGQHYGTGDLDLHLSLELLEGATGEYYGNLCDALQELGLRPDEEEGRDRRWRWTGRYRDSYLVVELLSADRTAQAGHPQTLPAPGTAGEDTVGDSDEIRTLGLAFGHLVHMDRTAVERDVQTRDGRFPNFRFPIAGVASWLALKADAIARRDEAKDAYDVVWLLQCLGPEKAAEMVSTSPLWSSDYRDDVASQLSNLAEYFGDSQNVGPGRYLRFLEEMDYQPLIAGEVTGELLRRDATEAARAFSQALSARVEALAGGE